MWRQRSQGRSNGWRVTRPLRPLIFTAPLLLSLAPAFGQSLPSDAMMSHSFNDMGPNLLLSGPLKALKVATLDLPPDRHVYIHVARGSVDINGQRLQEGDGARVRDERQIRLSQGQDAEVLVFDLRPQERPQMP